MLIVDDDASVREALSQWFLMRGFSVATAEDGVAAIEQCKKQHFDLITLDLEMPRMSGMEAIGPLRTCLPEATIVVLTGYGRDTETALLRGAAKVLQKPMRMTALEAELLEVLPPGFNLPRALEPKN